MNEKDMEKLEVSYNEYVHSYEDKQEEFLKKNPMLKKSLQKSIKKIDKDAKEAIKDKNMKKNATDH